MAMAFVNTIAALFASGQTMLFGSLSRVRRTDVVFAISLQNLFCKWTPNSSWWKSWVIWVYFPGWLVALLIRWRPTVAYAGFSKGGGGRNFRNFEKNKDRIRNCSTQNQSDFLPKIRWRAKITRSLLKFSPIFCSKLGEEQKKKGLHSNLVPLFAQSWVQA